MAMVGGRARCAACNLAFTVPPPRSTSGATSVEAKKAQDPPSEMPQYVGFECRVCGTRMYDRLEHVGKKLKCADCGALTIVPPPPKPKPPNIPPALEGEQYELWEADEQPLPSQILAAQSKYIAVKCRMCDTMMYPTIKQVGQQIACPDCGTKNIVPPAPKPVVRRSVLTPDAATPALDPAAYPGERPLVMAPVGKMVHEEEQEAEYERALEKSRRTGKPMEIDRRGRPILPRSPLLTGILPFLFSRGVPIVWLALSVGFAAASFVLIMGIQLSMAGEAALAGMPIFAAGVGLTALCASALSAMLLQVVIESSEGNRKVQHWPPLIDWFGSLLYTVTAGMISAIPGWAIAQIPSLNFVPEMTRMLTAASAFVFLPIILLSQLDINSPWGVFSGRVLTSLFRCPFSWALFYLECGMLAAICGAASYYVALRNPFLLVRITPLYIAVMIVASRLLGRLAWRLAEVMAVDSE
jgi:DNA-directed RNA polymerase subunit M/transcription elongation factor TFIIS